MKDIILKSLDDYASEGRGGKFELTEIHLALDDAMKFAGTENGELSQQQLFRFQLERIMLVGFLIETTGGVVLGQFHYENVTPILRGPNHVLEELWWNYRVWKDPRIASVKDQVFEYLTSIRQIQPKFIDSPT